MKKGVPTNLCIAGLSGAAIWILSPLVTGHKEPWDADSLYYVVSLLVAGVLLGAWRGRPIWHHAVGIFLGQLLYLLVFLSAGPLIIVGAVFLAGYSLLCLVGAAVGSILRHLFERIRRAKNSSV